MACIAGRVDPNGKLFLLLQNSWTRMPLVEVPQNYLVAVEACISYAPKKYRHAFQQLMEEGYFYSVNKALVADCSYGL